MEPQQNCEFANPANLLKNSPSDQVYANGPKSIRKHPKSDHFPRARRHPPETWFLGSRQGLTQQAFQTQENAIDPQQNCEFANPANLAKARKRYRSAVKLRIC